MNPLHDSLTATAPGPMSRGKRWLCAAVLVITVPVWMLGLLLVAATLAIWALVAELTED
jgi:hypothetical protein